MTINRFIFRQVQPLLKKKRTRTNHHLQTAMQNKKVKATQINKLKPKVNPFKNKKQKKSVTLKAPVAEFIIHHHQAIIVKRQSLSASSVVLKKQKLQDLERQNVSIYFS